MGGTTAVHALLLVAGGVIVRHMWSRVVKAVLAVGFLGACVWAVQPRPIPYHRLSVLLEEQQRSFAAEIDALRLRERGVVGAPQMRAVVQSLRQDLLNRQQPHR